jgi:hypothetical protein
MADDEMDNLARNAGVWHFIGGRRLKLRQDKHIRMEAICRTLDAQPLSCSFA